MDAQTLQVYENDAAEFTRRHRALEPTELYHIIRGFFHPGQPTADVGCGSGRDTAWLVEQGFPAIGFDASEAMLDAARDAFPGLDLRPDSLPSLSSVANEAFSNVLCSAVLMHLPREHLITAALALARILIPGGRLVLTVRPGRTENDREPDGRLFTTIPAGKLTLLLESAGFQVLNTTTQPDTTRPEVTWTVILAEKSPLSVARGLDRIQSILAQDVKTATYKLALIRAFCAIARTEAHSVVWRDGQVYVPLWLVAVQWLTHYWPLLTHPDFVAQIRGESPTATKQIAFRGTVAGLAAQFGRDGIWAVLREINENPRRYARELKVIGDTIRYGPVTFSGSKHSPTFGF